MLDIAFQEDACRIRKDHASEHFARLKQFASSVLQQEQTVQFGISTTGFKPDGMMITGEGSR